MSADVIAALVAELGTLWRERRWDWWPWRGSGLSAPARSTGWSSSTGSWPPWCTSAMGPLETCRPDGSALAAPRSPGPSAKSGLHWPSEAAPLPQAFACGRSPRSSTTSAPAGRAGSAGRPSAARTASASCADLTHARQSGVVKHPVDPAVEIFVDAGCRGLGARTGGRVVTPPHRKFKKNPPEWYEGIHELRRKARSSRRIRVEHGIAHRKHRRAPARHHGRREHMSDTVQAGAGLLSHQQTTTRNQIRQAETQHSRTATPHPNHARAH